MPVVKRDTYWCLDDTPLRLLLEGLQHNNLNLPELLMIADEHCLMRYIRVYWLVPVGADTLQKIECPFPTNAMVGGMARVNTGDDVFGFTPPFEDVSVESYIDWYGDPCPKYLEKRMRKVRELQSKITSSDAPEDKLLASWFKNHYKERLTKLFAELEREFTTASQAQCHENEGADHQIPPTS